MALTRVAEVEAKIAAHDAAMPAPAAQPASLPTLATDLRAAWDAPTTDARLKKRIVRTVIQEFVADIDQDAAEIVLIVHWIGGVHTELRLPKRRRGQRNSAPVEVVAAVRQLVLIVNDDLIAGILNRNRLVTAHGNRWTRERVTSLRSHHRIPVDRSAGTRDRALAEPEQASASPWHHAQDAQAYRRGRRDRSSHPLPDGPWIFSRASLTGIAAQTIAVRARHNPKYPTGSRPDQQSLFVSMIT